MSLLSDHLALLPAAPGVYLMRSQEGELLYVGKATSLRNRVRSYFQESAGHPPKVAALVEKVHDVEWIVCDTPLEALMLENTLIKQHEPHYNILLKDDKAYPYIRLDADAPWPRAIRVHRREDDGAKYFGPYGGGNIARALVEDIDRAFGLRGCKKNIPSEGGHDRPCLRHQIGRCPAPCAGRITQQAYHEQVAAVEAYLSGGEATRLGALRREMARASERMDYERAAALRDRITAIETTAEKQRMVRAEGERDVFGLVQDGPLWAVAVLRVREGQVIARDSHVLEPTSTEQVLDDFVTLYYSMHPVPREVLLCAPAADMHTLHLWLVHQRNGAVDLHVPQRGDKAALSRLAVKNAEQALARELLQAQAQHQRTMGALEQLQELLQLPTLPRRMEAYDISHTFGVLQVASQVVFIDALPAKKEYRHYRIKRPGGSDDFASMKEVVGRRLTKLRDDPTLPPPDVLLIDGGPGQLNAALEAMAEVGVSLPCFSLAKRLEEIFTPGNPIPLLLPNDSYALHLIQRLRDEAHRFAIAFHRSLRGKQSTATLLDAIPGIGPARRRALLAHFGSLTALREATAEDFAQVPGINRELAEIIFRELQPSN